MQTISINPNFEKLNQYFPFFMTKGEYVERDRRITEASGFQFFPYGRTYADYKANRLHRLETQAQSLEVTFDPNALKELLEDYNLHDHYPDILFVLAMFDQIPGDPFPYGKPTEEGIQESLEELKVLKYVSSRRNIWGDTQIILRSKTKKNIEAKIDDPETVEEILDSIGDFFIKKHGYYNFDENRFLAIHELDNREIEAGIKSLQKKKPGRKPGINQVIAMFIKRFVVFLNNETRIKAQPNTEISNEQCRLVFRILVILCFIKEQKIESNEEDYIRTILRNATTR